MNHLNMSDFEEELLLSSSSIKWYIEKNPRNERKHCVVFNLTTTSSYNVSKQICYGENLLRISDENANNSEEKVIFDSRFLGRKNFHYKTTKCIFPLRRHHRSDRLSQLQHKRTISH